MRRNSYIWNYKLKTIAGNEYELKLDLSDIRGTYIKKIMQKTLTAMNKKDDGVTDYVDMAACIPVHTKYYSLVLTSVRSILKKVNRRAKQDGYNLLNSRVDSAYLQKDSDSHSFHILIKGDYHREG